MRQALILLMVCLLWGHGYAQERYYNREEGYSIETPTGWERVAEPGKVSMLAPKSLPLATIDVVVEPIEEDDLGKFVSEYLQIAGKDGAKTLLQEETEVNGRAAVHLRLLYPIRGSSVQMDTTIFIAHDRAFAITGMTREADFATHSQTFDSAIGSFRLEEGD